MLIGEHKPILLEQVIELIQVNETGTYLDGTFGGGGHSEAMLQAGAAKLTGLDRDLEAISRYRQNGKYRTDERLTLVHSRASEIKRLGLPPIDGGLLDLGVSSMQLETASRGFSFQKPGPLDMRMDNTQGKDLLTKLRETSFDVLATYLKHNAGLHNTKSTLNALQRLMESKEELTTSDVAKLFPKTGDAKHPATRFFLGLRMWVNEELEEVKLALPRWIELLKPGGRLLVLTFHSTEDRLVKRVFKHASGRCICENQPCYCSPKKWVRLINKKPIVPSQAEMRSNPRSRSAKLRCVEKIAG